MAKSKGNRSDIPNPNHISNKDIIQRLNFLYQASALLGTISTPTPCSASPQHQPKRTRVVTTSELSRSYIDTMKIVGQKTNTKIDPSVKRCVCKNCSSVLIPGISTTVRVKDSASHRHLVSYVCHTCRSERRIPAPPVLLDDPMGASYPNQPAPGIVPAKPLQGRRRRHGPAPRLPPHFARDIGHVVFRGNQIISGLDLECSDAGDFEKSNTAPTQHIGGPTGA